MIQRVENTMKTICALYESADVKITNWMAKHGVVLLRLSLGVVFFWFGFLKFFPGLSPAQDLAIRTTDLLTFGLVPGSTSIILLAAWEVLIGIGMLTGRCLRATLLLLFLQMLGAIAPVLLFPGEVFTVVPVAPTLEGQYIIKNIVIVSAALVIGATVRGGRVSADPGKVADAAGASTEALR